MKLLRVKNFGPIQNGYEENDGWFPIHKITLFIGDNGTGKSTIAKMVSIFSWIEKALVQNRISEKELYRKGSLERFARYHKIENFFQSDTELEYIGDAYSMVYNEHRLTVHNRQHEPDQVSIILLLDSKPMGFKVPKIMYVGSERNFLSVATNPQNIKGLPESLGTFLDEFKNALEKVSGRIDLPVGGVSLSYQKQNKIPYIHNTENKYTLRLTEASSGIQSATPLFIVSRYLAHSLKEKSDSFIRKRSSDEEKAFKAEIARIAENPGLSEEVKTTMLELLSAKSEIGMFQNIVEEPEQNLFPDSQRSMLNSLLKFANSTPENELLITTHSPYLLSYLSLAMKAAEINILELKQHEDGAELLATLEKIVPLTAIIRADAVAIYQVTKDGRILLLPQAYGVPADDHFLNARLMEMNDLFTQLLEIEMEMEGWQ